MSNDCPPFWTTFIQTIEVDLCPPLESPWFTGDASSTLYESLTENSDPFLLEIYDTPGLVAVSDPNVSTTPITSPIGNYLTPTPSSGCFLTTQPLNVTHAEVASGDPSPITKVVQSPWNAIVSGEQPVVEFEITADLYAGFADWGEEPAAAYVGVGSPEAALGFSLASVAGIGYVVRVTKIESDGFTTVTEDITRHGAASDVITTVAEGALAGVSGLLSGTTTQNLQVGDTLRIELLDVVSVAGKGVVTPVGIPSGTKMALLGFSAERVTF